MNFLNKSLLLALFPLLFFAATDCHEDYNIMLTVEGLQYDSVIVGFVPASNRNEEIYDTARIIGGVLKYNFEVHELHEGFIIPFSLFYKFKNGKRIPLPASRIRFYINSGDKITINAVIKDSVVSFSTQGNELSRQQAESLREKREVFKQRLAFETKFNMSAETSWTDEDREAYWAAKKLNDEAYQNKNIEFITNHTDFEYSARLLLEIQDKQRVIALYSTLSSAVQESYFGKLAGDMIDGWSITTPGLMFPTFNSISMNGEQVNLLDYRGKYVLLDFWGSWCAPCIAEIPDLKKLQNQYQDELAIIGLVCNDKKEKAQAAIEMYHIDWVQIISDENEFPARYGLAAFPTKVLLDEKGVIVRVFVGTSAKVISEIEDFLK